jgi:TonB family protein
MKAVRIAALILLSAIPLCASWAQGSNNGQPQAELLGLMVHASDLQDVWSKGSQPFHLHLQVHAEHITARPVDGTYDEVWLAPDRWRREIAFPDFHQVEIGDKDSKWVSRNVDFRPSGARAISTALETLVRTSLRPDETVSGLRTSKKNGVQVRCADVKNSSAGRTLCFNSSGTLASDGDWSELFEYSDYMQFESKVFPRHIQAYQKGNRVLDIRAQELPLPPDLGPDLFVHDVSAQHMASCLRPAGEVPAKPVKTVVAEYPESARRAGKQGTVILYVLISGDGHVERTRVLQSVDPAVDQATVNAIQQWIFPPVQCGSVSLPSETEVPYKYSINILDIR